METSSDCQPPSQERLDAHQQQLWLLLHPLLQATPYQPPRVRDLARLLQRDEAEVRLLLHKASGTGLAVLVAHDHFFTTQAVLELAQHAEDLFQDKGQLLAAEYRDRIGVGRKLAIQILEFFNQTGFTRRVGDIHILNRSNPSAGGNRLGSEPAPAERGHGHHLLDTSRAQISAALDHDPGHLVAIVLRNLGQGHGGPASDLSIDARNVSTRLGNDDRDTLI